MNTRTREITPHEAPELFRILGHLTRRAGLAQSPRVQLLASPVPNAAASGTSQDPRILLTTALLEQLDRRELTGVLAHEVAHLAHGDLGLQRAMLVLWQVVQAAGLYFLLDSFLLLLGGWWPGRSMILAAILTASAGGLPRLMAWLSRKREFKADEGAARLTGDPLGLASALGRLHPRWRTVASPWFGLAWRIPMPQAPSGPLDTHPPVQERIEHLEALASLRRPEPWNILGSWAS